MTGHDSSCIYVAVERQYHTEFFVRVAPSKDIVNRTVKQFEKTGEMCVFLKGSGRDKCIKGCTRNTYGRRCVCCMDDNKTMKKGAAFSIADRRVGYEPLLDDNPNVSNATGSPVKRTSTSNLSKVKKKSVPRLYGFCVYGGHHMRQPVV